MKTLLIIDMQHGFVKALKAKKQAKILSNVNELINNGEYDLLLLTKFNNTNELFLKETNYFLDESLTDIAVKYDNHKNYKVFDKSSYGLTPEIMGFLKANNITQIDICGLDLDACVLASAYNLFDNGIKPTFILSACDSISSKKQIKIIKDLILLQFGKDSIIMQ